ncbi:MAG TPA: DUF692 domain-containing protein [Gemmatimonadaceae bacterium]|nr:DUF692 domain-containing protein [Gemmatimonadaceae bacterium]
MSGPIPPLGLGIGWRPEIARFIETRADLGFVEVIAENVSGAAGIPPAVLQLRERGVHVVPHGVSLSLGSADAIDRGRVRQLADLARTLDAPLVSEHIAFVRGGGIEAGHLLPVPRTRAQLRVLVRNIRAAQALLPVPLAVENVAALFDWPNPEITEADFLRDILDETGALLLLDLANVHANARNLGSHAAETEALPLERIAYVHVAGGEERDGVYYDTHAHRTPPQVLELVEMLSSRRETPGFMLERDDHFPSDAEMEEELDAIVRAVERGRAMRFARAV